MVAFIDEHRDAYGVEPICARRCRSPRRRTFRHGPSSADPTRRSARAQRDDELRVDRFGASGTSIIRSTGRGRSGGSCGREGLARRALPVGA